MVPVEAHERISPEERREQIVAAAVAEFARGGLHGTSTEAIARRVGVSQPYLFRFFGTKKELFVAAIERCLGETLALFRRASEGLRGEEALQAMGKAYVSELLTDRDKLLGQMQAYAACDDPDVRKAVQRGYGDLYEFVERASGASDHQVQGFFAFGMLLNVMAAMNVPEIDAGWARRLTADCMGPKSQG
ncbi:MAG: TetR/AcrR family transcriptional regulator [Gaiellaceae bacterium]